MSLIVELKRRNVVRVAMAYIAIAWLVVQVLDTLAPLFGISDGVARLIVIVLAIGLVPALVLSWVFEWTSEGLKKEGQVDHDSAASRESTKFLDRLVIGVLALAVVYFAIDKFVLDPTRDIEIATQAAEQARDDALVSSYGEHSIAVVPFTDLSPDKDQEYFSDGIAEEIITLLSQIRNLRVIARSSAFSFKGQNLAASVIANRLNVRYVMEGSVRRAGERLRITTTIIDASTDTQLWSESFDRDFGDVFAIQDEIAAEVVDRLEMQINGTLPSVNRVDPESYSLFLQARHVTNTHNADSALEADRLLRASLEIDSSNVAAWLLYFVVDSQKEYWGHITEEESQAHMREAMEQVLKLDPGNKNAQSHLAFLDPTALTSLDGQIEAAALGLKLLPTDVRANQIAASTLSVLGELDRAIEYFDYVLGKDPLCSPCLRGYMLTLMSAGEYERAAKINLRYQTSAGGGVWYAGIIQLLRGDAEAALETIEASNTITFIVAEGMAIVNWTLGREEDYATALTELEAAVDDPENQKYSLRPLASLARVYAWVGRHDEAFEILDGLINPPESFGPTRWSSTPLLASLHDDPRWAVLLEKEGIAPHQLESYQLDRKFPGPGLVPKD